MDPDETLKHLRALSKDATYEYEDYDTLEAIAQDFSKAFNALDEWLSAGGFLPEAWQHD